MRGNGGATGLLLTGDKDRQVRGEARGPEEVLLWRICFVEEPNTEERPRALHHTTRCRVFVLLGGTHLVLAQTVPLPDPQAISKRP